METGCRRQAPIVAAGWALALLCATSFMIILDASIVLLALPSIERELGFSPEALQWAVSAYALTFGGLLLLGGRAADLLGRRRVFMIGLALFTVASLLCGLARSPATLIGARAVQGIGAAVMAPTALSVLMTTFEEGAERSSQGPRPGAKDTRSRSMRSKCSDGRRASTESFRSCCRSERSWARWPRKGWSPSSARAKRRWRD